MKNILKNNIITIITCIITILICLLILPLFNKKIENKSLNLDNKTYKLSYDNSWKVVNKTKSNIKLEHTTGNIININIEELPDNKFYLPIDDLIDDIIYKLNTNNKYKLITYTKELITKNNIDGYKLLYENDKNNSLIYIFKKNNKLISINYESSIKYFDALLDSVNSIIYNFELDNDNYDIKTKIDLKTSAIKYSNNKELDKILKDAKEQTIYSNNYYVKYKIPSNFNNTSLSTNLNTLSFSNNNTRYQINTSIRNTSIYSYIKGISSSYNYYRKNEQYTEIIENIDELKTDYLSYIYMNTFTNTKSTSEDKTIQNIELIYSLNKNHTLVITINSTNGTISKKLIDMINIIEFKNYAKSVTTKKDKNNNYLVELKKYNLDRSKIDNITIKIPDKYEELDDNNTNKYEDRTFGLLYNKKVDMYNYEIQYKLNNITIDKNIEIFNSTFINNKYGDSSNMSYTNELTLNNKKFIVYDGGYTTSNDIMFAKDKKTYYKNVKILFYILEEKEYTDLKTQSILMITISGNNKDITNNILEEVTNFEIKELDK